MITSNLFSSIVLTFELQLWIQKKVHPIFQFINLIKMKEFLPGVIVGILLCLLYLKNQESGNPQITKTYEQGKEEGIQLGLLEANKRCELEKRKAMEDSYYNGYEVATAECRTAMAVTKREFEMIQQQRDQEWQLTMMDSVARTRSALRNYYRPKVQVLQEKNTEMTQQYQQLYQAMSMHKIDPHTLQWGQHLIGFLTLCAIGFFLVFFIKAKFRGRFSFR